VVNEEECPRCGGMAPQYCCRLVGGDNMPMRMLPNFIAS